MNGNCTDVMATITRSICTDGTLGSIAEAGAFRINSAHVDVDDLAMMIESVRRLPGRHLVLLDTKGPELRTTAPLHRTTYTAGNTVDIHFASSSPCTAEQLHIAGTFSPDKLREGQPIEVDDGRLAFTITADSTVATVTCGGDIDAAKSVNLPGVDTSAIPAVSPRDERMVTFALEHAPVDMIAHSFVRRADDIRQLRRITGTHPVAIIAKIECAEAVEQMEEIAREADGLLVARGDLSTAIDPARIPGVQLRAARLCRQLGKPCIVATQLLSSLQFMDRASRADTADIATGVMEGMAWLLLCDETARSARAVEAVKWVRHVIDVTQKEGLRCGML